MWTTILLSFALLTVPAPEVRQDAAPSGGPTLSISGVVQDEQGKPVSAAVVLRARLGGTSYLMGLDHNRDVLAAQQTGVDGRFALQSIAIPLRLRDTVSLRPEDGYGGVELLVWAEGKGVKWIKIDPAQPTKDLEIVLPPEAEVAGVVRGEDGQTVEGATIRLIAATASTNELDPVYRGPGDLNLISSEAMISVKSDAQGRFQFPHGPRGYRVGIAVEHPSFHRLFTMVNTSPDVEVDELRPESRVHDAVTVHRSPLDVTLKPAESITLVVTTHDGKPVRGGGIYLIDSERHYGGQSQADQEGRVHIPIKKSGTFKAYYTADPARSLMNGQAEVTVVDGQEPEPVELRLPAAEMLEGRTEDAVTGEAVPGVLVRFVQIKGEWPTGELAASSCAVSDADGKFQIPVVAGKGSLRVGDQLSGYHTRDYFTPVEIVTGEPIPAVTLRLPRGLLLRGRVVDVDGKGIGGALIRAQERAPYFRLVRTISADDGSYELAGLPLNGHAHVFAMHERGTANATVAPQPNVKSSETVAVDLDLKLKAGVALQGCVLKDGKPRPDLEVQLQRSFGEQGNRFNVTVVAVTDAEGRYRFTGLEPGDNYSLEIRDGDLRPPPDWTHGRPYVKTVKDVPVMEIDDANLMPFGQTLAGIVVSPQGEPVPGITVGAQTSSGRSLSRPVEGPPPWTETDSKGRFRLTGLPDEDLQLMAYRSSPQGGTIRFPALVNCERNQTDVRIILDPRLTTEVEDLDAPK